MPKYLNARFVFLCGSLFGCLLLLWSFLDPSAAVSLTYAQTDQPIVGPPEAVTGVISSTSYLPIIAVAYHYYFPLVASPPPLLALNPPAHSSEQSPNAYLHWSERYPEQNLVRYDLYLEANNPAPTTLLASGLTQPHFDPDTFTLDTQYFWRVVATDEQGQQVVGPVWTFRVEPLYDPPAIGKMIKIPAGDFLMGCDRNSDGCRRDSTHLEEPLHRVYLDAYEIDKYEVTNLEYRQCIAANACNPPRRFNSKYRETYFNDARYNLYPVMYVSWWDSQDYCKWVGKRLPTEAEWEKAARGPVDTRRWPWGNEPDSCNRANYRVHCAPRDSTQVGAYPTGASAYGLMDMSGNMFEWVQDLYDVSYYQYAPVANPQGPTRSRVVEGKKPSKPPEMNFVIRGGSYTDNWWYSRVAHRHWGHHGDPTNFHDEYLFRSYRVGFRCARSLPAAASGAG